MTPSIFLPMVDLVKYYVEFSPLSILKMINFLPMVDLDNFTNIADDDNFTSLIEEEKFLIERESLKYDEKIKKSLLREAMHKIKVRGYESISHEDSLLIKVFIGYVSEMENINEILMSLVDCLKKGDFREKILYILTNKTKNGIAERLKI